MKNLNRSLNELVRSLDTDDLTELLDLAETLLADRVDPAGDALRNMTRAAIGAEKDRRHRIIQREFDLRAVGDEASIVYECESPPRWAIRDYALWLRAGGGRPVTALCCDTCPCRGFGPEWLHDGNRGQEAA